MAVEIELVCGQARAVIATMGAELKSWTFADQALIWTPDAVFWDATAPLLFPVVGATYQGQIRVGEKTYPLGLHGFARQKDFSIGARTRTSLVLELKSDSRTRALYPYDFHFLVEYVLHETGLSTTLKVKNSSLNPMPYACGLHPGFAWPFAGGEKPDYSILFENCEDKNLPKISKTGLFLPETREIPLERHKLALNEALLADEALCFLNAKSHRLCFQHVSGPKIWIEVENFPHFALWSKSGAPYLCIEVWTGHGDPEGFTGELKIKPSMRLLQPGEQAQHRAYFRFEV
jgi:galactose mutarotase-like enzyme